MNPVIFLALPVIGGVTPQTTMSLYKLGATLASKGVGCGGSTLSYPDITECRNVFLSIFYNLTDATHLLFVDADMRFTPELVLDMLALDKPVVGCFYRRKCDDIDWVGSTCEGEQNVVNGFMPVEKVGMGITLISRACIFDMKLCYNEMVHCVDEDDPCAMFGPYKLVQIMRFFDKIPMGYASMSEDYSFCKRWRDIGGEIYANVSHAVGHIGQKEYSGRLWDQIQGT